jgi:Domain of unknown function (DUF2017)
MAASSTRFRRRRGGVVVLTAHPLEAPVLAGLLEQLAELVAPEASADADPLAAMVGIGTATEASDDPVLARLFPDAYPDDAEAAGEFRRYTENGLRESKQAAARLALATLEVPGDDRPLTTEETQAWLTSLNDLRLALGTRLDVGEDWAAARAGLGEDDPARFWLDVYDWLSYLQETLVGCLR